MSKINIVSLFFLCFMVIYPIELFTMNVILQIVEIVEEVLSTFNLSEANDFQFENEMMLIDMIALKFC